MWYMHIYIYMFLRTYVYMFYRGMLKGTEYKSIHKRKIKITLIRININSIYGYHHFSDPNVQACILGWFYKNSTYQTFKKFSQCNYH